MKQVMFAGTLKELTYENSGAMECRMKFVPDTEYVVTRKWGTNTKQCVAFQPTGKWQLGYVFMIDDKLVIRCQHKTPDMLLIGGHYEFVIDKGVQNSIFDFMVDDAPSSLGQFSVTTIRAL